MIRDHVTSHFMYVNSMALRIAGIDGTRPTRRAAIRRDEQGEPTGVLEETAVDLIWYKDELGFLGTRDEKHPRAEGSHGLLCRQRLYHGQSGPCGRRGDHAGGRKQGVSRHSLHAVERAGAGGEIRKENVKSEETCSL